VRNSRLGFGVFLRRLYIGVVVQSMEKGVLHGRFVVQVDEIFNAGASQAQR
jgi:hypothetical protein